VCKVENKSNGARDQLGRLNRTKRGSIEDRMDGFKRYLKGKINRTS